MFHYKVNEKLRDNKVSFKISEHPVDENKNKGFAKFLKKQNGGKKKKKKSKHLTLSSSSSTSSLSSSSSTSSSTSEEQIESENLVYRFKTKDKVVYSKLRPAVISYYDIYGVDYLLPTFFSSIRVNYVPSNNIYVYSV